MSVKNGKLFFRDIHVEHVQLAGIINAMWTVGKFLQSFSGVVQEYTKPFSISKFAQFNRHNIILLQQ